MTFDTAFERSHPPNTTMNEKDSRAIHDLFYEFHESDNLGLLKSKLVEYVTTVRKEAREAALKESVEFFCYWLLRAYEAIHRDMSYEEGENLDSIAREINQVIGFAGYEPESATRHSLLAKKFSWNELHLKEK